jgi:hypothetical protein
MDHLPGFGAERSLFRSHRRYSGRARPRAASGVVPGALGYVGSAQESCDIRCAQQAFDRLAMCPTKGQAAHDCVREVRVDTGLCHAICSASYGPHGFLTG